MPESVSPIREVRLDIRERHLLPVSPTRNVSALSPNKDVEAGPLLMPPEIEDTLGERTRPAFSTLKLPKQVEVLRKKYAVGLLLVVFLAVILMCWCCLTLFAGVLGKHHDLTQKADVFEGPATFAAERRTTTSTSAATAAASASSRSRSSIQQLQLEVSTDGSSSSWWEFSEDADASPAEDLLELVDRFYEGTPEARGARTGEFEVNYNGNAESDIVSGKGDEENGSCGTGTKHDCVV